MLVDPLDGDPIPIRRLIERTLGDLAPSASAVGCADELDGVRRILRDGNGADRQRRVYARTGSLEAVMRHVVEASART